ncbi:hypothetical protein AX15_004934 [Amanita polypyramis BW_CC]|nr:hypothetical protein AX15_004934 [Amanita polypyramis BW_CC]
MRLVTLATILAALSLTVTGHERVGRKHHSRRLPKTEWTTNSTVLGSRGHLEKRFNGARFSFYDAGLSACGGTYSNSDFIVALNTEQFAGGDMCSETITIMVNGKTAKAKIVDECMSCPYTGLDFSRGLFDFFASESEGIIYGSWIVGDNTLPTTTTTTTSLIPTTTWTPPSSTSTRRTTTSHSSSATPSSSTVTSSATPTPTPTTAIVPLTGTGLIVDINLLYVQFGSLLLQAPPSD